MELLMFGRIFTMSCPKSTSLELAVMLTLSRSGCHFNNPLRNSMILSSASIARTTVLTAAVLSALCGGASSAQSLTPAQARSQVEPFYDMLNQPAAKDVKALAEKVLAPDWKSYSSDSDFKDREAFVGQVTGFGKVIPNLKWEIKELLVDGNRIVVRSEASGTPVAPFFGVPPSGKSFRVMAIDIHTVKDGKAVVAYHVEDWAAAMGQLKAPSTEGQAVPMNTEQARQLVAPFYEVLSLQHSGDSALKVMEAAVLADWSFGSTDDSDRKRREQFTKETMFFAGVVPNLRSEVKDVLVQGDKVIVRRTISGTPAKPLFGIPPTGKSFAVMAIDIHTIRSGKIARTDYVANWAAAPAQLAGK